MNSHSKEVQTSHIERMLRQMERSSRRWEKMVFPMIIAFVLLAGYGFFLIYSVTRDMSTIATIIQEDFRTEVTQISQNIDKMVRQVEGMKETIAQVSTKMDPLQDMTPLLAEIKQLDDSVSAISGSVRNMDNSVVGLNQSMHNMGRDVGDMNESFSSPTKMFKRMMTW
ncbi:MAG: hypothetical protein V3V09_01580 [Arenicellales bacterium]